MSNTKYTYAVARIRALETSLLSDGDVEQLLSCGTADQALQYVIDKGWGDLSSGMDIDAVLKREGEKTWEVIREVAPDMSVFDVFLYANDYHNLKAAIKENYAPPTGRISTAPTEPSTQQFSVRQQMSMIFLFFLPGCAMPRKKQ